MYMVLGAMDDLPDRFSSLSRNNWKVVQEAKADLQASDFYKCRTGSSSLSHTTALHHSHREAHAGPTPSLAVLLPTSNSSG